MKRLKHFGQLVHIAATPACRWGDLSSGGKAVGVDDGSEGEDAAIRQEERTAIINREIKRSLTQILLEVTDRMFGAFCCCYVAIDLETDRTGSLMLSNISLKRYIYSCVHRCEQLRGSESIMLSVGLKHLQTCRGDGGGGRPGRSSAPGGG